MLSPIFALERGGMYDSISSADDQWTVTGEYLCAGSAGIHDGLWNHQTD